MRAAPARKPRETTTSSGFHLRARSAPLFPRLRLAASMAPPLSRSLGASSSAAALHFPCAPSPFSAAATAATARTVAFLRLGSSVSSRRGFRCEASAPGWGASGGECPVQRASFTSTASYLLDSIAQRLCSCRGVFAHDISRRYCSLKEGHNMSVHNSLKGLHFSADISNSSGSQGSDKNDMESVKDKLLVDCGPDQECVTGGIVALGKFDALHLGHRELAIQASKAGTPFLLSFVGMAEVLGWEYRAPIVAKCDRKRVLSSWAPLCGDVVPLEFHVEFSKVRQLSPRQFVERLSKDLRISGVVAGENYRFGYRASGDASELVRLCEEYGLEAHILSSVLDSKGSAAGKKELVSSTRVRQALAVGDVNYVAELLGRRHRLVLRAPEDLDSAAEGGKLSIPRSCLLNQHPKEGLYESCSLLADDRLVGPCSVVISTSHVHVEPHDGPGQLLPKRDYSHVGIDLGG